MDFTLSWKELESSSDLHTFRTIKSKTTTTETTNQNLPQDSPWKRTKSRSKTWTKSPASQVWIIQFITRCPRRVSHAHTCQHYQGCMQTSKLVVRWARTRAIRKNFNRFSTFTNQSKHPPPQRLEGHKFSTLMIVLVVCSDKVAK